MLHSANTWRSQLAHQSWSRVQSIMVGGPTWSDWIGRWTGIATSSLRDHMLPCVTGVFGRNFEFMQDNASPHVGCDTVAFVDHHDVEVEQLGREGWGYWWRPCIATCGLFSLLEGYTHAISNNITSVIILPNHALCSFLAFILFYRKSYVNNGNVGGKFWFSRNSREPYITWVER